MYFAYNAFICVIGVYVDQSLDQILSLTTFYITKLQMYSHNILVVCILFITFRIPFIIINYLNTNNNYQKGILITLLCLEMSYVFVNKEPVCITTCAFNICNCIGNKINISSKHFKLRCFLELRILLPTIYPRKNVYIQSI